ncbi:MAG TPA: hypothetical protein V6D22_23565 [Candidatus Obscuribacterales bacterium]
MSFQAINQIAVSVGVLAVCSCLCLAASAEPNKAGAPATAAVGKSQNQATPGKAANEKSGGLDLSKPYGYHLEPILEKIQANTEQRQKISHIVISYRSTIEPLRDQYREKQQEFIGSMLSGGAAEMVMAKQVELGHLSSEITSKYCLMRLEIRRLLSPQQILQFESYGREHGWNH